MPEEGTPINISLADLWTRYETDPIWAARGWAIDRYAILEQTLCSLMAVLAGVPEVVAAAFFYKITAYRTRLDVMELFIKKLHGDIDPAFWRSLYSLVCSVDGTRNNVVHWHSQTLFNNETGEHQIRLAPGNIWYSTEETPYMTIEGLQEFSDKCHFVALACNTLISVLSPPADATEEQIQTWRGICQQPLTYPPPSAPPPNQNAQTPESPSPTGMD